MIAASALAVGAIPLGAASPVLRRGRAAPIRHERWITLANGHKIWTERVGEGPIKILILHGGPGFSHDYMNCFANFLPQEGYELHFYDQLGCGRSDRPEDPSLWNLPRYLGEVEEVRQALRLEDFVLVGHSWGGILGIEYALAHPERLRGFVLSNMTASFADFAAYTSVLKSRLPKAARDRLEALETTGQSGSEEYARILEKELYTRYICRLDPWPKDLQHSFAVANGVIYNQMQGPNEFVITGNLKDWNRWTDLPNIRVPTLVMGARYDEMNPDSVRREAALIPSSTLFMSETGSHLAMWDDQTNYFHALISFLKTLRA